MRFVPLTAMIVALAVATVSFSADAKPRKKRTDGDWVRLHITVNKHRSFLDAGNSVTPGTMYYHNYVNLLSPRYSSYGPDNRDDRWPLPGPYDWAPY
jgi:hypothetical protein